MSVDCDICERSFSMESEKYEHILQMVAHTGYMWAKYKALESRHRDLVAALKEIRMGGYLDPDDGRYCDIISQIDAALKEEQ